MKGKKFEESWLGPYKIMEKIGNASYKLLNIKLNSRLKTVVNGKNLKIYFKPTTGDSDTEELVSEEF